MSKKTDELINELKNCTSLDKFIKENESQFLDCSAADYIAGIMEKKGLKKIDVVKRSNLSEVYTYQILAGMKNPDRDKLLCIIFAIGMDTTEADTLLKIAGKSELYVKNKRDSIIVFALERNLSLLETNELLYDLGENTLS